MEKKKYTETILIMKPAFAADYPTIPTVKTERGHLFSDPLAVAGDHVYTKRKLSRVQSCMIEDTMIVDETEKAWFVQVDYYEVK